MKKTTTTIPTYGNYVDAFLETRISPSALMSVKKWLTVWGSLIMMLPIGLPWYWGNTSMYAVSYVTIRGESLDGIHTPWIISFYFMFNAVGLFIAGTVAKYTGKLRSMLLFGIILFLSGFYLTYFSVKKSVVWMNITLGVISGLGGGIVHGMALQYAVGWSGNDLGFVNSLVQSGYNAGSIFINPFITFCLNPENASTDVNFGASKIFSSAGILDRVPLLFVLLGSLCLGLFALGFVMVRDPPNKDYNYDIVACGDGDNNNDEERMELLSQGKKTATVSSPSSSSLHSKCPDGPQIITDTTNLPPELSELSSRDTSTHTSPHFADTITMPPTLMTATGDRDKQPSEMIKTKAFLTLCISLMMYDNAMLVLANYYKEFGATYIDDDHFLTFLGTVLTSTTVVAFPFWGLLTDQIGVKKTLISMYSISSVLCFTMFFTPRVNKILYLMNIASLGSFLTPIYSILIIATCKMFGKAYYSSNIGVVASLSLLCNFVNPLIFENILNIGWFYIFCYGGCLTGTALIFIILTLPDI